MTDRVGRTEPRPSVALLKPPPPSPYDPIRAKSVAEAMSTVYSRMKGVNGRDARAEMLKAQIPHMKALHKNWEAKEVHTRDGSRIFVGAKEYFTLVITPDGRIFSGVNVSGMLRYPSGQSIYLADDVSADLTPPGWDEK